MREARAAARLSHPSAVTVYDVVEEDGKPWIVMELVNAHSLAHVISSAGPLPVSRVAEIGQAVLAALTAAHAEGILHRDVKPANVLLDDDGRVVLTDFGIATLEGDPALTASGLLLGAPAYIAPERARGLPTGPASDLWSLGATLYAAVTGGTPFHRASALASLTAIVSEDPAPPQGAGLLTPVIMGLLERDPHRRMGAEAARRGLAAAAAAPDDSVEVTDPPVPAPIRKSADAMSGGLADPNLTQLVNRPGGRRRVAIPVLLGSVVLALVAAAVVVAIARTGHSRHASSSAASHPQGSSQSTPSSESTPSGESTPRASEAARASPKPSGSAGASTAPSSSGNSGGATTVPAGFRTYRDPSGFAAAVPDGWSRTVHDGLVDFHDPASSRYVRFDQTSSPPADPVADWTRQESSVAKRLPNYQRLAIQPVDYRGYRAADWDFTFGDSGSETRVRDRGFRVSPSHGYAIYWSVPADQWTASQSYFDVFARTFHPAG